MNRKLIHFSTHGVAEVDAARTSLHLAGGAVLQASDIMQLPLVPGAIVFLASCETARASARLPDQTFGPCEAFLHSGAAAVIAPLFAVTRHSAAMMAARFYSELIDAPPHVALARAQVWLARATLVDQLEFIHTLISESDVLAVPNSAMRALFRALEAEGIHDERATSASVWALFEAHV
jgi:CHAT domain-containing protein